MDYVAIKKSILQLNHNLLYNSRLLDYSILFSTWQTNRLEIA